MSCFTLNTRSEAVILHYGTYTGTIDEPGCHFVNCFGREIRTILTSQKSVDIPNVKVLDGNGNPIIVSAILTYRFVDSKKALLNVLSPNEYVMTQASATLKQIVSQFPYESEGDEPSLKNESQHIGNLMRDALQKTVAPAGAIIQSMQLNELNYAPEVANAMLKKQQAKAMIAAREHIVQGAVAISQMAIKQLEAGGLEMTAGERVKLITNLLTVTCSDSDTVPTVQV
ncbi:hypothetical protein SARC_09347 [Sphaeroforma arctica JP610]|uniref:Band 7 domain-containing protein n=1 Tax=Sphaeroforma arctica JP610 TaxID=667725 RepID=A0A0L0FN57_9EUKA|nr:hypothetical protein SARC_09347 [Sphaeroforma arctica JP610]KNC78220.1 hypothetical protein SARC_09347 [Sphaeroforma arctica JP610]|eukprot:XP_014152122.1 hypothetical protein SARC_09347 [Sphaeroforma arctica JP610]